MNDLSPETLPHLIDGAASLGYTPEQVIAIYSNYGAVSSEWTAFGIVIFAAAVFITVVVCMLISWLAHGRRYFDTDVVFAGGLAAVVAGVIELLILAMWVSSQVSMVCPEYFVLKNAFGVCY